MNENLSAKIIKICNEKIKQKGPAVGLSFYAFFENKNNDPELLIEIATWWIKENKLDHFEKAIKIRQMIEDIS